MDEEPLLPPEDLIDTAISEALLGPKRVTGDSGSAESFDLDELIKMKNFLSGQKSASKKNKGLRFTRLIPDGSTGGPISQW